MRAENVKVGQNYLCKVGKNSVPVTLVAVSPKGQMTVQSVSSKKKFQVADAARLSPVPEGTAQGATGAKTSAGAPKTTKAAKARATTQQGAPEGKKKRASLLNEAAAVLQAAGQPMNAKEMVEAVMARGQWATKGKTPAATLYASILREIQKKGQEARFVKTERGKFAARA